MSLSEVAAALVGLAAGFLLAACGPAAQVRPAVIAPAGHANGQVAAVQQYLDDAPAGSPAAQLAALPVKGRAPMTGYDNRAPFGPAWSDTDHNGCDQRNDVLRRDLTGIALKPNTRGCVVLSGLLVDPYTAKTIRFVRGPHSADVQIDHVVALGDAWQTGAQQLTAAQRLALANDPLNLLAVDGPTNQRKGDADAASWLPPNKPFRCAYAGRQIDVKTRYHLWVTDAERAALAAVLAGCP